MTNQLFLKCISLLFKEIDEVKLFIVTLNLSNVHLTKQQFLYN